MATDIFFCQCKLRLIVPEELLLELELGEQVVLFCEQCCYLTLIEHGDIIEHIPPRGATRWTETYY